MIHIACKITNFPYNCIIYKSYLFQASCLTVAILLHYFFMAAFSWMLCEGILIFIVLKFIFYEGIFKSGKLFMLIGWGKHRISWQFSKAGSFSIMFYYVQGYLFLLLLFQQPYHMTSMVSLLGKLLTSLLYISSIIFTSYRCWISEEEGAIWAFIGPMLLIIMVIRIDHINICDNV